MKEYSKGILILLISGCMVMVVFAPITMDAVRGAIKLWLNNIVPSLFPFFIFSNLIKELKYTDKLPAKFYPLIMGVLSGYPMGAKVSADYYKDGNINDRELVYILSYSMVTGPAFIVSTIGIQFLHSYMLGVIIAVSHYLGAFFNSLIFKCKISPKKHSLNSIGVKSVYEALTKSILDSFRTMSIILAYIIIFFIIINLINRLFDFDGIYGDFICGILEMTIGCSNIGIRLGSSIAAATISSFLISFGGLSVLFQTMSMINNTGMSITNILKIKFIHGILSAIITFSIVAFVVYFIL